MLSPTQQYIISLEDLKASPVYSELNDCFFFYDNGIKNAILSIIADKATQVEKSVFESQAILDDLQGWVEIEARSGIDPSNFDAVQDKVIIATDILADMVTDVLGGYLGDKSTRPVMRVEPIPGPNLDYLIQLA